MAGGNEEGEETDFFRWSVILPMSHMRTYPKTILSNQPGVLQVLLPVGLFLGFFFPNTRIEPLGESMIAGRWIVLFIVVGLALARWLLTGSGMNPHVKQGRLTVLGSAFILSYSWLGISTLDSVNPPLSFLKWLVFLLFLAFCAAHSTLLRSRRDLVLTLYPFILVFVVFIWLTPAATRYYPQPLQDSMGHINGFLVFAPALGHFLAAFGIPGVLFMLTHPMRKEIKLFLIATLLLAILLTFYSGSRTGVLTVFFVLGLALFRWRPSQRLAFLKVAFICFLFLFLLMTPKVGANFSRFLYKYPDESELFLSRTNFWARTLEAFQERPVLGYGFGVQKQLAGMRVGFFTIGFREQGSTYYGLLEEVGLVGALPVFIFFSIVGYRSSRSLWHSRDPLELFLSRIVFAGLVLAAFENYLLYLGNATSILVVFAFFLRERLKSVGEEVMSQDSSPSRDLPKDLARRIQWKV